ncbi:MAG: patatin-like phospholipase family protein, partial [Gemmatimonadaceae bacterium]
LVASLAAVPAASAQQAASCGPAGGTLALVLPGGGAKGFAHLGVLHMLDSLGIVPDYIVGTSAGAMIGALYASGLDVPEIERETRALGLDSLVGRYSAPTPPSLGNRRALLSWEGASTGFTLQTSVVREAPLNALLNSLVSRGNLMARGDFDRLPIPFRAVAADIYTRKPVVLASGDLAEAVRASSSIPIVFRTVHADGRDLVDGGIANNVPIDVARALGATRIILSALRDTATSDLHSDDPMSVAAQLVNFLFEQPLPPLQPGDVVVHSDVSGVNQLDFSPANIDRITAAGMAGARALLDDHCLTRGRVRPRGTVPPIARQVTRPGTDRDVARILKRTLGDVGGRATDMPALRARLLALAQVERYRALWLHPQRGPGDSVVFAAEGLMASNEQLLAGAAFDRELGPRVWLGRLQRIPRRNAEVTGVISLGNYSQELSLTARRSYDVLLVPWSPLLVGTITRTRVRDIRDGDEYPAIPTADWMVETGLERRFAHRASLALTAFVRQWDEPVFAGSPVAVGGLLRGQLFGGSLLVPRGTVELEGTARYWRTSAELRLSRRWRTFTLQPTISAVIGEHLPLQNSAFLGGTEVGFPGFLIRELRGAQTLTAALHVAHPVYGPISLQGLVAGGALQQAGGGVFRQARGYFGVRGGLGVSTALGPVAVEYGRNDRGRGTLWMRFGDWF